MTAGFVRNQDEVNARGATFLDDMDMVISPNGGHLVPVAMKHGVHVCWACGEPFDEFDRRFRMVEKYTGGAVPVGVHAQCISPKPRGSFYSVASGLSTRRALASVAKATEHLASAVAEGARKIVTGIE